MAFENWGDPETIVSILTALSGFIAAIGVVIHKNKDKSWKEIFPEIAKAALKNKEKKQKKKLKKTK